MRRKKPFRPPTDPPPGHWDRLEQERKETASSYALSHGWTNDSPFRPCSICCQPTQWRSAVGHPSHPWCAPLLYGAHRTG